MGIVPAKTGQDLLSGEHQNVNSDYDGVVRLAPARNLLPDPGFEEFRESDKRLRYWLLSHVPRPTHWMPFVRDTKTVLQFSRQNTFPLPLEQETFDIDDELVSGASPIDASLAAAIPDPDKSRAEAYSVSTVLGYPAGWYSLAHGWIADQDWMFGTRIAGPGPRSEPFQLGQGEGFLLQNPREIPATAGGVIFFLTDPQISREAALTAPLIMTQRFPAKGLPEYKRMIGPLRNTYTKPTIPTVPPVPQQPVFGSPQTPATPSNPNPGNPTYIGGNLAPLRVWIDTSNHHHGNFIKCRMRYKITTAQGVSQYSNPSSWNTVQPGRKAIYFIPKSFPVGTLNWIPQVQFFYGSGAPTEVGATNWKRTEIGSGNRKDEPAIVTRMFTDTSKQEELQDKAKIYYNIQKKKSKR